MPTSSQRHVHVVLKICAQEIKEWTLLACMNTRAHSNAVQFDVLLEGVCPFLVPLSGSTISRFPNIVPKNAGVVGTTSTRFILQRGYYGTLITGYASSICMYW
jgi:hypothetical protein